jgi:hypothetical protein
MSWPPDHTQSAFSYDRAVKPTSMESTEVADVYPQQGLAPRSESPNARLKPASTVSCTPILMLAADGTPQMTGCLLPQDVPVTKGEPVVSLDFTRTVTLPSTSTPSPRNSKLPYDDSPGPHTDMAKSSLASSCTWTFSNLLITTLSFIWVIAAV